MKCSWFLLLAACAFGQTTAGTDQTGGVTGTVTDAFSHMPIKKVMVSINPTGNLGGRNQGGQSAITDATGTYSVSNLQAGSYRLVFQHQNYPQARFGGVLKNVDVKAGEIAGPVNADLIPGAAVSGHIADEDGDPLQGCFVQLHPAKNPEQGVSVSGLSNSNEDGEFRIYAIAPGKYILTAQCGRPMFQPRPFSAGPEAPPRQAYPMQFYPLSIDPKGAEVVELTPGAEKSGVDFRMKPAAVTQVKGAFSPSGADWHGGNPMVLQLFPVEQSWRRNMMSGANQDQAKGTFEFRQVFPGFYVLVAFSNGAEEARIGAVQRIEVSDQPVAVVLELHHSIELTGKVEIDATGGNTANTNKVTPGQLGIQLMPQFQIGLPSSGSQVADDGSFTLKGVIPAPWRLQVNSPFAFVKSAWLGNTDVTNAPMDLSSGAGGTLRIVVSTNTATIRGSAPAGAMIFSQRIDDDVPFRSTRGSPADQTGQYRLENLPPGKYRLLVADSGSGPMSDEGGQEVTVHEGETVMLDLKAPAGQ